MTLEVTDLSFKDEVLASDIPVLVDFWAPWCGPCRMVGPVVDQLAKDMAGLVKVVKVNSDDNPEIASTYGIQAIPALLIFKGGINVDKVVGAVPKITLVNALQKYL